MPPIPSDKESQISVGTEPQTAVRRQPWIGNDRDRFITARQLRHRFGDISDMCLWRWCRNPALAFPKPALINRRRYWRLAELEAWEKSRVVGA